MTKRPVIGIPCTQSRDEWGGLALGNSDTYLRAIEAAGGTPLLLPLSDESGVLAGLYEI
ncbi:MAG: gamma-glutamyl-gamma-aminobutyrate hydrolase family protein, partial [Chloroflexia bacterium]|nr:gamma-glutamyl-gamma-aminobutyrate hydrolase family protein [Chloroflexia bacterium]